MYDRNDVPFYVLTTDPEQSKDDVLDDVWTALDKMDGRGEVYVRHRASFGSTTESAFDRSFHLPQVQADPLLFDTLDVDHRHTGAEHARYEARQRIRVHQVRRRDVLWIRQWSDKTKVCRAASLRSSRRRPHQVSRSSPSRRCGHIDDAVLGGYRTGDDLNRLENAIFKTMKLGVSTAHVRMFHRGL
jgi:hypothetical protein